MTGSAGPPGSSTWSWNDLTSNQANIFQQQMINTAGLSATLTTSRSEYIKELQVSKVVNRDGNGYFYVISVDATDEVYYRVWKGGLFPFLMAKVFKWFGPDVDGNKSTWSAVTKRTHLPATLGAAYEKIGAVIQDDILEREHSKNVKELLKTKPENLKMIGGLERLAEGDVDAPEADPNAGSSHSVGGYTYSNNVAGYIYSNNVAVAGSGTNFTNQPGSTIPYTPTMASGSITGVAEMEVEKITLNGTDIEETMADRLREATEEVKEEILSQLDKTKEQGETNEQAA